MNYFELFDLPFSLSINKDVVRKKFLELSRKNHPDYFANSNKEDQQKSLEDSALLNKAYKTFNNTDDTIKYVLMQKGLLVEEEKYQLKPDFLMQMMEINEALADAQFEDEADNKKAIEKQLIDLENEIYEPVKSIIAYYKEGITTKEELLHVKDYYFKKKYLHRLSHQLNGKL